MSSPESDFEQLMERVRTGDPEAQRQLFERYGKAIRMIVRYRIDRRLRSQFDSIDFTQDAWASFFHGCIENCTFDKPEDLVAFLARVARHKLANAYRKRYGQPKTRRSKPKTRQRRFPHFQSYSDKHPARQPTPSHAALVGDEWRSLLKDKPVKIQRALVMLRDGYSQREIAERLGLNVKRIQRAIKQLSDRTSSP
jgi:RNA polymerase sigma-70 factor (ECF subfamily)